MRRIAPTVAGVLGVALPLVTAVSIAGAVVGTAAFRRRDLVGE